MKRSWPWTIGWLVTAAVSFVIAFAATRAALEPDGSWLFWIGVVLSGGFGAVGVFLAIWSAGSVPCPNCGLRITGFEPNSARPQLGVCADCNVYVGYRDRVLRTIGADEIHEQHPFRVSVDGNVQWPSMCLVCNGEAVRETETTWDISKAGSNAAASAAGLALFAVAGAGFVRYGGGSKITLRTPACGEHEGGAKVFDASGGRATIGFRSRKAHLAFLEANRHATVEPTMRGMIEDET